MDESTNREKVLKKIRTALLAKTDNPYPKFPSIATFTKLPMKTCYLYLLKKPKRQEQNFS
jgi:hypothetical protein